MDWILHTPVGIHFDFAVMGLLEADGQTETAVQLSGALFGEWLQATVIAANSTRNPLIVPLTNYTFRIGANKM
jgi:hypothetical protein